MGQYRLELVVVCRILCSGGEFFSENAVPIMTQIVNCKKTFHRRGIALNDMFLPFDRLLLYLRRGNLPDIGIALLAHAVLCAIIGKSGTNPRRAVALRTNDLHIGDCHRHFHRQHTAARIPPTPAYRLLNDVHSLDRYLTVRFVHGKDTIPLVTRFRLISLRTRQHDYLIVFINTHDRYSKTSRAVRLNASGTLCLSFIPLRWRG